MDTSESPPRLAAIIEKHAKALHWQPYDRTSQWVARFYVAVGTIVSVLMFFFASLEIDQLRQEHEQYVISLSEDYKLALSKAKTKKEEAIVFVQYMPSQADYFVNLFMLLLLFALFLFSLFISRLMLGKAQAHFARWSINRLKTSSAQPILLLRAFETDNESYKSELSQERIINRVYDLIAVIIHIVRSCFLFIICPLSSDKYIKLIFERWRYVTPIYKQWRVEDLFVKIFEKFGPLIAVGRPSDHLPHTGAVRLYIKNDCWQEVVKDLIDCAAFVIVYARSTPALFWEMERIVHSKQLQNTGLLLLTPNGEPFDSSMYDAFREQSPAPLRIRLPVSYEESWFIHFDEAGATGMILSRPNPRSSVRRTLKEATEEFIRKTPAFSRMTNKSAISYRAGREYRVLRFLCYVILSCAFLGAAAHLFSGSRVWF